MLKEFCITPQVFDAKNLSSYYPYLKILLEIIESSGYIIDLNNGAWARATRNIINNSQQNENQKNKLNSIYDFLKDRHRIVGHPKGSISPNTEEDWLSVIEELNNLRELNVVLATKKYKSTTLTLEQLEDINISESFGITGSEHYVKSAKELKIIFLPLLSYAKKVTIIDPYFNISIPRFKDTLYLIAQTFKEKRGTRTSGGTITINLSIKVFIKKYDNQDSKEELDKIISQRINDSYHKKWKKIIEDIYIKYQHSVKIYVWDRKEEDTLKMHDRYIITDQAGISSAAGTDKDEYQLSEWSIKTYSSSIDMLSKYKAQRDDTNDVSIFRLKYEVNNLGILNK